MELWLRHFLKSSERLCGRGLSMPSWLRGYCNNFRAEGEQPHSVLGRTSSTKFKSSSPTHRRGRWSPCFPPIGCRAGKTYRARRRIVNAGALFCRYPLAMADKKKIKEDGRVWE